MFLFLDLKQNTVAYPCTGSVISRRVVRSDDLHFVSVFALATCSVIIHTYSIWSDSDCSPLRSSKSRRISIVSAHLFNRHIINNSQVQIQNQIINREIIIMHELHDNNFVSIKLRSKNEIWTPMTIYFFF